MTTTTDYLQAGMDSLSLAMATQTNVGDLAESFFTNEANSASAWHASADQFWSTVAGDASSFASSLSMERSSALSSLTSANNALGMAPNHTATIAMSVIMALVFAPHAFLGLFYATWLYAATNLLSFSFGVFDYISTFIDTNGDFLSSLFYTVQITTLTIAPGIIMAGVYYFLLTQLMNIYRDQYSLIKRRLYSWIFISVDVVSLLIQAGGGAMAAISEEKKDLASQMIAAGAGVQMLGMTAFLGLFASYCF